MRIAIFHATLPEVGRKPGGVEVAVHRLATWLARRGEDEVTVLSLTPCPEGALYRHVRLFEKAPWLGKSQLARWLLLPALLNFVTWRRFDILHLHGDDWFFFRRPIPTVRTLHGSALQEARSATSLRRRVSQYLIYPLERLAARLAATAAAVGAETARIYGLDVVVDNGVDSGVFFPGEKSAGPRILFVGTWEGRKRGSWMFDLFVKRIQPRLPAAELVFVSDRCPRHTGVTFVRFPDDRVLAALYRQAWVFACPSSYEGFGMPYLEALASGTAVVASPNGGADRVLAGGGFGIIAPDEDFSDRVVDLLTDAKRRHELETAGLARAKEFSWNDVAARHRGVYVETLEKAGRRRPASLRGEDPRSPRSGPVR